MAMNVEEQYYAPDEENQQDMMMEKGDPNAETKEGEQPISIQITPDQARQAAQLIQSGDFESLGKLFASILGAG